MRRFASLVNFFLAARLADYRPRCSLRPLAPGAVAAPCNGSRTISKVAEDWQAISKRNVFEHESQRHTVVPGDTLSKISKQFTMTPTNTPPFSRPTSLC